VRKLIAIGFEISVRAKTLCSHGFRFDFEILCKPRNPHVTLHTSVTKQK